MLKGSPRAFRAVDDFGDANPGGHGKLHARSASLSYSKRKPRAKRKATRGPNERPAYWQKQGARLKLNRGLRSLVPAETALAFEAAPARIGSFALRSFTFAHRHAFAKSCSGRDAGVGQTTHIPATICRRFRWGFLTNASVFLRDALVRFGSGIISQWAKIGSQR